MLQVYIIIELPIPCLKIYGRWLAVVLSIASIRYNQLLQASYYSFNQYMLPKVVASL